MPLDIPNVAPNGIGPLGTPVDQPVRLLDGTPIPGTEHACGVYRNYAFFLVDQDNPPQPITFRPFTLGEIFSNYSSPAGFDPPTFTPVPIVAGQNIADIHQLWFFYHNACNQDDNQTFTQKFTIKLGDTTYLPTTTIQINRGNFGGTLKVDRTITVQ